MAIWSTNRCPYCNGCSWWRYFNGFYGCWKFKVYSFDDFERLCGGRYRE